MKDFDYSKMNEEETPFAINLSNFIKNYINPKYVQDIGCGSGTYVRALRENLIPSVGYDINPQLYDNPYVINLSMFDIEDCSDLILCLEVAEHISEDRADDIVTKICSLLLPEGSVIWSAALPGQGGVGHINCQPKKYWEEKFLDIDSMYRNYALENSCYEEVINKGVFMGWFRNNFMIFTKGN